MEALGFSVCHSALGLNQLPHTVSNGGGSAEEAHVNAQCGFTAFSIQLRARGRHGCLATLAPAAASAPAEHPLMATRKMQRPAATAARKHASRQPTNLQTHIHELTSLSCLYRASKCRVVNTPDADTG